MTRAFSDEVSTKEWILRLCLSLVPVKEAYDEENKGLRLSVWALIRMVTYLTYVWEKESQ